MDENLDKTIDHEPATPETAPRRWNRAWVVGALAVAAVGGLGVAAAMSNDFGPRHMLERAGWGGPGGHHGPHGPRGFGGPGFDHMMDRIDATPEQKEQLRTIMRNTRNEIEPLIDKMRDSRGAVVDILGAETIDRAAAEKLRSERLADIDAASQKVTNALLDAAAVLTPEQRKELREKFEERRGWGRW